MNEIYTCPGCGGVASIRAERCEFCGNPFVPVLKSGPTMGQDEAGLRKQIAELQARLVKAPGNGRFHYDLGQAYHELGELSKAQEQLLIAVALGPDKFEWLYLLAWNIGLNQGWNCADVEKYATTALAVKPDYKKADALIHLSRGNRIILFDRGEDSRALALEEFKAAIELDEKNPYGFYFAGCVYELEENLEQAVDFFRKAAVVSTSGLAPNKEDARLFARVGMLYCKLDRAEDARQFLSDAVALDPQNSAAQDMLAAIPA
jgi:tetratricopeptide (TPR) repeat protein